MKDIAASMEIAVNTAYSRLRLAREDLACAFARLSTNRIDSWTGPRWRMRSDSRFGKQPTSGLREDPRRAAKAQCARRVPRFRAIDARGRCGLRRWVVVSGQEIRRIRKGHREGHSIFTRWQSTKGDLEGNFLPSSHQGLRVAASPSSKPTP